MKTEDVVLVVYVVTPNEETPGKLYSNESSANYAASRIRQRGLPCMVIPVPVHKLRGTNDK